jgi:hypothetical protein
MVHPGVARFRLFTTLLVTNNGHFIYHALVFFLPIPLRAILPQYTLFEVSALLGLKI